MNRPWITWCSLAVVAVAAGTLSFDALRHLAVMVGAPATLAWLVPLAVDAAAVVATRVWLDTAAPERARRFARVLALVTVALSIAGNTVSHWLVAYKVAPAWWTLVAVASVPPLVLAMVAHLAALAATPGEAGNFPGSQEVSSEVEAEAVALVDEMNDVHAELGLPPFHVDEQPGTPGETEKGAHLVSTPGDADEPDEVDDTAEVVAAYEASRLLSRAVDAGRDELVERARHLVAEHGPMGRIRLARELDCSEHQARRVLARLDDEARPVRLVAGGESR